MRIKELTLPAFHKVKLNDFDPAYTDGFERKEDAHHKLEEDVRQLAALQELFSADNRYALLLVFQAMDAAGKDGVIKHVMSGVNPQGCSVVSFKAPNSQELDHDYLWRCVRALPAYGKIGIFNRSYYEEVLIVRVHPKILAARRHPHALKPKRVWVERYEDINNFERYLTRNGFVILKFFLHVSRKEQKERFLARLDTRDKNWKFSPDDVRERSSWDAYQHAYQEMLRHTSTAWAPWHVIPADHKWFTRVAVADIIVRSLKKLDLSYPAISGRQQREFARARRLLESER